jgi:hypothetical protein
LPDTEPFSGFKPGNEPLSAFIFILRSGKNPPGVREPVLEQQRGLKHVAFQRNMYNRLLFDCPEVQDDVIFATVSNQCPQRPPVRETLPALKLQQKV